MRKFLAAVAVSALMAGGAYAATTTLSIVINSGPSTSVSCSPAALTAPVAAGTLVCPVVVAPASWSGALTLSGPNASSFALSGSNLVVGAAGIANAGTLSVTITSTP